MLGVMYSEGVLIFIGIFLLIFPVMGWLLALLVKYFKDDSETPDQPVL